MPNPITIRVGGVPEHFNLPWHIAIENGCFLDSDLNVEYRDYPGGTGAMTGALRKNELDMAIVLTEGAVADVLNNDANRIVKIYVESPLIWGIHVSGESAINDINQIRDRRYAISRSGSGSHLMAIVDASERNWPTESMEFVEVGNLAGARRSLKEGRAETFFWERFTTQPLVDSGEFRRIGQRKIPWPAFAISTSRTFLAKHPAAVRDVLAVINQTTADLMTGADSVETISSRYDLKRADTQDWFERTVWSTDFEPPLKAFQRIFLELNRLGITHKPDASIHDVWTSLQPV